MNQILIKPDILFEQEISNKSNLESPKSKYNKFYKIQFIISCVIAFVFIVSLLIRIYITNKNEKISEQLINVYNVSRLYSNNTNYSSQTLRNSNTQNISSITSNPFVIGIIKIDKINLNYPILSESNEELLDISICRFAGPMPNETRKSLYCRT